MLNKFAFHPAIEAMLIFSVTLIYDFKFYSLTVSKNTKSLLNFGEIVHKTL